MKIITEFIFFTFIFVIALTFGVKAMVVKDPAPETATAAVSGAPATPPVFSSGFSADSLGAKSAILIYVDEAGAEHKLFGKNEDTPLLIASVTKLMTATVALENIPEINISVMKDILEKPGAIRKYKVGENYTTDTLYRSLLIESNNDAAWMLAENYGLEGFVKKMNDKAVQIGMNNTNYGNPVGLDPADDFSGNTSTASDLATLAKYIYTNQSKIFDITRFQSTTISDTANKNIYTASTTNKLLLDGGISATILGGKTGETPEAHKNLLLVFKKDPFAGYFISVVLNTGDNFSDTKSLLQAISE